MIFSRNERARESEWEREREGVGAREWEMQQELKQQPSREGGQQKRKLKT